MLGNLSLNAFFCGCCYMMLNFDSFIKMWGAIFNCRFYIVRRVRVSWFVGRTFLVSGCIAVLCVFC